MSVNEKIVITLDTETPAYAQVETSQGQARSSKIISVESLTDVLGKHATRTSPMLPNNLLRYKERSKDIVFMTQIPAQRRLVKYSVSDSVTEYNIMTPNLVLFTRFERIDGTENVRYLTSHMVATKSSVLAGIESVYFAPFGNIYIRSDEDSRNHEICWGSDVHLGSTLKMIDIHPDIFFRAIFNTDLDSDRFNEHTIEDFRIFKTNHIYKQMHNMFENGSSEEEVLAYLHEHLKPVSELDVNQQFNIY